MVTRCHSLRFIKAVVIFSRYYASIVVIDIAVNFARFSRDFSRDIVTKYDMQTHVGLPRKRKWGMKAKWGRPSNHTLGFFRIFLEIRNFGIKN